MTLVQARRGRQGADAQGFADWAQLGTKVRFLAKEQGGVSAWKPRGGNIRGQRASGYTSGRLTAAPEPHAALWPLECGSSTKYHGLGESILKKWH